MDPEPKVSVANAVWCVVCVVGFAVLMTLYVTAESGSLLVGLITGIGGGLFILFGMRPAPGGTRCAWHEKDGYL